MILLLTYLSIGLLIIAVLFIAESEGTNDLDFRGWGSVTLRALAGAFVWPLFALAHMADVYLALRDRRRNNRHRDKQAEAKRIQDCLDAQQEAEDAYEIQRQRARLARAGGQTHGNRRVGDPNAV